MSRLTRDGTAEPVSRDQILRHARGQGSIISPVQLTTSRIGNLTRLIHTLLYVMTIHTYYVVLFILLLFYVLLLLCCCHLRRMVYQMTENLQVIMFPSKCLDNFPSRADDQKVYMFRCVDNFPPRADDQKVFMFRYVHIFPQGCRIHSMDFYLELHVFGAVPDRKKR